MLTNQGFSVCPRFLSWERAASLHVDELLARNAPPTAQPRVAPLLSYGKSRPDVRTVHVCRPPAVRFLSMFDDGADADFETLAGVTNAARAGPVSPAAFTTFDRVVLWVDARNVPLMRVWRLQVRI